MLSRKVFVILQVCFDQTRLIWLKEKQDLLYFEIVFSTKRKNTSIVDFATFFLKIRNFAAKWYKNTVDTNLFSSNGLRYMLPNFPLHLIRFQGWWGAILYSTLRGKVGGVRGFPHSNTRIQKYTNIQFREYVNTQKLLPCQGNLLFNSWRDVGGLRGFLPQIHR